VPSLLRRVVVPTWGAVIWGVLASGVVSVAALWLLMRERRPSVLATGALAAMLGPLLWDLILRHTGGDFFVDAPGVVFPVSFEDTGSGVFATAIAGLATGLGPLRAASGRRVACTALACGVAALVVDVYLY
jgi:hypothetical protein